MAASGVFIRSMIWINNNSVMPAANLMDEDSSVLFCAFFAVSHKISSILKTLGISRFEITNFGYASWGNFIEHFQGLDPIFLHCYVDLDSMLRYRREIYTEWAESQFDLLPFGCLADACFINRVGTFTPVLSWC